MIFKKIYTTFLPPAILLVLFCCAAPLVFAQESSVGVTVKPAIIEDRGDPGGKIESAIKVTNDSDAKKTFYLIKRDIKSLNEQGLPVLAEENEEKTGFELSAWISLNQEPVELGPRETKEIPFSINIPANAEPGSHFGIVYVSSEPPRQQKLGLGVGFQVGTIVSIRISGDIIEEGLMRDFKTSKFIYNNPEIDFSATMENRGNVIIRPRGPLEISNMFGKKVKVVIMNDSAGAVLPKAKRDFSVSWSGDKWSFGRYEAIASLAYGEGAKATVSRSTSFWILPLKIILPVIGGILFFLIIMAVGIKLHVRKKIRQITGTSHGRAVHPRVHASIRRRDSHSSLIVAALITVILTLLILAAIIILFA